MLKSPQIDRINPRTDHRGAVVVLRRKPRIIKLIIWSSKPMPVWLTSPCIWLTHDWRPRTKESIQKRNWKLTPDRFGALHAMSSLTTNAHQLFSQPAGVYPSLTLAINSVEGTEIEAVHNVPPMFHKLVTSALVSIRPLPDNTYRIIVEKHRGLHSACYCLPIFQGRKFCLAVYSIH